MVLSNASSCEKERGLSMLRIIFTNRWILGYIGFLILFSFGCLWWYRYDTLPYKQEAVKAQEKSRKWKEKKGLDENVSDQKENQKLDKVVNPEHDIESEEIDSVETHEAIDVEIVNEPSDVMPISNDEHVKKRLSPYGFGPYPDLPPGFPFGKDYWDGRSKESELMARVHVKLFEQGTNIVGATIHHGLVYPIIPGTIYVEWEDVGTEKYITRMIGDPYTGQRIGYNIGEPLTAKDVPEDVKVLHYPSDGIDPYEFLNLKE